jgi:hypothetical protein
MKYRIRVYTPVEFSPEDPVYEDITEVLAEQLNLESTQPENFYEIVQVDPDDLTE